jgi:hypothetical protein
MGKEAVIALAAAHGLLEAIAGAGRNPDSVLKKVGLDRSSFSHSEGFIAVSLFTQILEEAASLTGDPCFGLHFGERYNPKNIGPLAYVVLNSPTIAAAIENAARYLKIHNGAAKASLIIENDRACLRFSPNELLIHGSRQHSEYAMAVALRTMRASWSEANGRHWRFTSRMNSKLPRRSITASFVRRFYSVVQPMLSLRNVNS